MATSRVPAVRPSGPAAPAPDARPMELAIRSTVPYPPRAPQTLVIACSDGRVAIEFGQEVWRRLGVPEFPDRICVPGGPGTLHTLSSATYGQRETMLGLVAFLVTHHGITRVILVSHEGCGHYAAKYPALDRHARQLRQIDDLKDVSRELAARHPTLHLIERMYAAVEEGAVVFCPVM